MSKRLCLGFPSNVRFGGVFAHEVPRGQRPLRPAQLNCTVQMHFERRVDSLRQSDKGIKETKKRSPLTCSLIPINGEIHTF